MTPDIYISLGVLELYVAGTLSPAEAEEVQAMAARHEIVAEELKRIEQAHMMYAALHAPDLSPGIFDRIARRIEELPMPAEPLPEAPKSRFQGLKTHKEKPAAPQPIPQPERPRLAAPEHEKRRPSYGRFYFVIVLLLITSVIAGLASYYFYEKWQFAQDQLILLQTENEALSRQNDTLRTKYEAAASQLAPYKSPGVRQVDLKGQSVSPQSAAMVYWNPQSQDVFLQVENLPAATENKQYQLWAIDESGTATNLGILTSLDSSQVNPMKKVSAARSFIITLEPEGGSAQPAIDALYLKGEM